MSARHLPLWFLLPMLAGCAVGPSYHKPKFFDFPTKWTAFTQDLSVSAPVGDLKWWEAFNDPTLTQLIDQALVNNSDLKIAQARVREARGARLSAVGGLFPSVDGTSSLTKGNLGVNSGNQQTYMFDGGFDASWEIDIFGGGRKAAEAAWANVKSKAASEDQVRVSLLAEVVRSYLDYRRLERQLALTQENLQAQEQMLEVVTAQKDEGVADLLDVSRVVTQAATTEADIPTIEANMVETRGSLGVLIGTMPDQIAKELKEGYIPEISNTVFVNTPAEVIANRPDVRAAEQDLIAATANQGVAISNWFPKVTLSALLGFQTGKILGNIDTWNEGGTIRLPILDFGRVRGLVQQADARQTEALATYEQTVRAALADVETSFTNYVKAQQRLALLQKAADAGRQAEELSRIHYKEGISGLIDVLDAQQRRLQAETSFAMTEVEVGQRYAALYKALGGGVNTSSTVNTVQQLTK